MLRDMRGTTLVETNGVVSLIVDFISPEIGSTLLRRLNTFCYGAEKIQDDMDFYSVKNTLEQFFERYDSKSDKIKTGMIGELLVHLFLDYTHPTLTSSAVFFNKEEKSIKKGFDLTFYESGTESIWYGEVKSSISIPKIASDKADGLLKTADKGLTNMLGAGAQRSRWESALVDADLTLNSKAAISVKSLLRDDAKKLASSQAIHAKAFLAAIVFHDIDHCRIDDTNGHSNNVSTIAGFTYSDIKSVVIQQSTIDEIERLLRDEMKK